MQVYERFMVAWARSSQGKVPGHGFLMACSKLHAISNARAIMREIKGESFTLYDLQAWPEERLATEAASFDLTSYIPKYAHRLSESA